MTEIQHPGLSELKFRGIKLKFIFSALFSLLSLWKLQPCKVGFYRRRRDWKGKVISSRCLADRAPEVFLNYQREGARKSRDEELGRETKTVSMSAPSGTTEGAFLVHP